MLQIMTREVQQIVPLLCLLATHANESGEQGPNVSCFMCTATVTMQHLFRCNTELRENWVSYHLDQEWFCLSACFSDRSRQCACVCVMHRVHVGCIVTVIMPLGRWWPSASLIHCFLSSSEPVSEWPLRDRRVQSRSRVSGAAGSMNN